jgi:hypothetical protein
VKPGRTTPRRDALTRAVERLSIPDDQRWRIEALVSKLAGQVTELPLEAFEALGAQIDEETARRFETAIQFGPISQPVFDKGTLPSVDLLHEQLIRLAECARLARLSLPDNTNPDRSRTRRALLTSRVAAGHFEALTGLPPTRQTKVVPVNAHLDGSAPAGPIHQFLTEVFSALGIEASADALRR